MNGTNFALETRNLKRAVEPGQGRKPPLLGVFTKDKPVIVCFTDELNAIPDTDRKQHCYSLNNMINKTGLQQTAIVELFSNGILPGCYINGNLYGFRKAFNWWLDKGFESSA